MSADLIDQYAAGAEKLSQAIRGLTPDDLKWRPADPSVGAWSIQEVVIHLADADVIWANRMKSIIADDNPTIIPFDQERFVSELFYQDQDARQAAQLFELNRKLFAAVLRKLSPGAFNRTGNHVERGTVTLRQSLQFMIEHLDHHLKFIHAKRAKMGKEMW